MVINYEKFPILRYFEKSFSIRNSKGFKTFNIDNGESMERSIGHLYNMWDGLKEMCRPNIAVVTKPFMEAVYRSRLSFSRLQNDEVAKLLNDMGENGVLVYNGDTPCYLVYFLVDGIYNIVFIEKECLTAFLWLDLSTCEITDLFVSNAVVGMSKDEYTSYIVNNLFVFPMLFKKYAKVEIEQGKCGKTIQSKILKEKLRNNIPFDVKIMDSTWFTTICRNEGFKVRGHFRLQPKKNDKGEWIKELIYINEFEKHGYHRQAKILQEV